MKKATETVKKEKASAPTEPVSVKDICEVCGGRGLLDANTLCTICSGSGKR